MQHQLTLIETSSPDWRISEEVREIGRQGIARARAALAAAHAPTGPDGSPTSTGHHNRTAA